MRPPAPAPPGRGGCGSTSTRCRAPRPSASPRPGRKPGRSRSLRPPLGSCGDRACERPVHGDLVAVGARARPARRRSARGVPSTPCERREELLHVLLVGRVLPGVAGGEDPRRAAERGDLEARVLAGHPRVGIALGPAVERLAARVVAERLAGLGRKRRALPALHRPAGKRVAELARLVRVLRDEDEPHDSVRTATTSSRRESVVDDLRRLDVRRAARPRGGSGATSRSRPSSTRWTFTLRVSTASTHGPDRRRRARRPPGARRSGGAGRGRSARPRASAPGRARAARSRSR